MFVIVRDDGKYVAPPGREKSYTDRLEEAWVFRTQEAAEKHHCPGNERVYPVSGVLRDASDDY